MSTSDLGRAIQSGSFLRLNSTEVHLDASTMNREIADILGRKADTVTHSPDLRALIGNLYVYHVEPYVPMRTGALRESGYGTNDGRIVYSVYNKDVNYAPIQYNTQYVNYTTPGTGPYWADNLQPGTPLWNEFIDDISPIIKGWFNDG